MCDCTSGFPKYILIRHSGNITILFPREGFAFIIFVGVIVLGSIKYNLLTKESVCFETFGMKEINISVSQLLQL